MAVSKSKGSSSESRFDSVLRSEEHTSELQSHSDLVCRLLLEKKKKLALVADGVGILHDGSDERGGPPPVERRPATGPAAVLCRPFVLLMLFAVAQLEACTGRF